MSAKVSPDTICARLQSVELNLLDIDKTHAKTIAANIQDALEAKPPTPTPLCGLAGGRAQQGQDAGAPKAASREGQAGQPDEPAHEADPNS